MIKIEADVRRNLLFFTLCGYLEPREIAFAGRKALAAAGILHPGYEMVCDIRECHPTGEPGQAALYRIYDALANHGLYRIIIVEKIKLTALQFVRIGKSSGYESITVPSMEDAEAILANRATTDYLGRETQAGSETLREGLRKHRRILVGSDHTVRFMKGAQEYHGIRILNLGANGCFAVLPKRSGEFLYEGAFLMDFRLEHSDLPPTPISAKIMRIERQRPELKKGEFGLGLMFLTDSARFIEWVDGFVSAYYGFEFPA